MQSIDKASIIAERTYLVIPPKEQKVKSAAPTADAKTAEVLK